MFLSVIRNRPASSRITFSSKRRGTDTSLDATRNIRMASTPYLSITGAGSTTLPRLFDIFWPFSSRRRSLTTTPLYGGGSLALSWRFPRCLTSPSPSPVPVGRRGEKQPPLCLLPPAFKAAGYLSAELLRV